jgi:RNA polymerase sigma-70 factor (ECF subfamily)
MAYTTSYSLLSRLKAGDEIAWHDFYRAYAPLIRMRAARDFGLGEAEREEVLQTVVVDLFAGRRIEAYDRGKAKFKTFLRMIVDRKAIDLLRARSRRTAREDADADITALADTASSLLEQRWDEEWQSHLAREALCELRNRLEPSTYQTFELYVLQDMPPAEVAAFLEVNVASVYAAKSRAVAHLRKIVAEMEIL